MKALIAATNHAVEMLYEAVRRMPEDKITWKPLDMGRSVLDQLQECATTGDFFLVHLDESHVPKHSSYEESMADRQALDTVDKCYAATKESTARVVAAIASLKPDQLGVKKQLPWGEFTVGEIAAFHQWNLTYHLGQINYIQTLYGDFEM